jgi:probable blue pigment (indigoidine) exporter
VVEADRYRDPEYRRVSGAAVYCRLSAAGRSGGGDWRHSAAAGDAAGLVRRSSAIALAGGALGIDGDRGMAMLLLSPQTTLEPLGIAAAFLGAMSMALGTWLSRRWAIALPVVALTGWQLLIGGIVLAPMAFLVDPPLHQVTLTQAAGYLWLCVAGAMLAYGLWFRGIGRLSPVAVSAMSLLSPVTAVLLGWIFLGQKIEGMALVGLVIVLFSVLSIQRALSNKRAVVDQTVMNL